MATPGRAAIPNSAPATVPPTPALLLAMLQVSTHVSDLIFSPGTQPHVEVSGQLVPVKIPGLSLLTPEITQRIAQELIGDNKQALSTLQNQGSCDISYSLPGTARFRVNVFVQRGSHAIVMRVIPKSIPSFDELKLPAELAHIADIKNGIVLVTGPTGSGKSSTLAAVLDRINETKAYHILTIEDPVEFMHRHKRSIIHQRELHSDTPSFALALRAALRQAPKVILVGEMRDKETIEIALEAAETGHLVLSTLHTTDASKTVERIIGVFPLAEQHTIRNRFAKSFRYIVSQRLLPRKEGVGRVAAIEILKVDGTHPRISGQGRGRRQEPAGCDARRRYRGYAALRRRDRKTDSRRNDRLRHRHGLCHQSGQFASATVRSGGRTSCGPEGKSCIRGKAQRGH